MRKDQISGFGKGSLDHGWYRFFSLKYEPTTSRPARIQANLVYEIQQNKRFLICGGHE
ncbi:MAG: hypothetical protein OIF50_16755 [Flavobacteriaceae bacterium]|nr:hypothetical protein [Flavobacteriaceae bacterium]